uniref:Uncharacterized protein n=1 Tax=viral metagenome TaxID=1070528 RepID=A0A6H2A407_9ZZZZ
MNVNVTGKPKITIDDLGKGDTFTWVDNIDDVFMIIDGEGIQKDVHYKHAVNLRTGGVIEPGICCGVLKIHIDKVTATVVY